MVNTNHIVHLEAICQTTAPPVISGASVVIPAIERISPQLTGRGERIGRTSCHCHRLIVRVKLEQLRAGPCISGVKRHIDRNITDDLNTAIVCILFQTNPLYRKLILKIFIKLNVIVALSAVVIHGKAPALADILSPLDPGLTVKALLHRHEQGIIIKPPCIFLTEYMEIGLFVNLTALISLSQKGKTLCINLAVVDLGCVVAEIAGITLFPGQNTLTDQCFQINEIRISCKGGEGLVR